MEVDYLIIGAGATGLAFLDVILSETDATIAIIDRRDSPGGHWNDAYPFVRLHQPSSFYGVASRQLGKGRISQNGYNSGLHELASKYEILHYYQDLMESDYLPSGRVQYFPMSEYQGDGLVRSLVSGKKQHIKVRCKLVNAGLSDELTSIPLTHKRNFEVADGVECVPPNSLPHRAPQYDKFTVIGGGKTAMDAVLWLLDKTVAPENITWVRPNDYWLFNRDNTVPHKDFFLKTNETMKKQLVGMAASTSVRQYCESMESSGMWHRINRQSWPEKFHAASCSQAEVAALGKVEKVIRAGHARRIDSDRIILDEAEVSVAKNTLFIDCTAKGVAIVDTNSLRVFDGAKINLLMVRPHQAVFSAAVIGYLEACEIDEHSKQDCARVTNFHDTPAQYLSVQAESFLNQAAWRKNSKVQAWVDNCPLFSGFHLTKGLTPKDTRELQMLEGIGPLMASAMENIPRILASEEA